MDVRYSPLKTAGKSVPPLIIIVLVRAAMAAAEGADIHIDENIYWQGATIVYSVFLALVNWIKNHKKGKEASA